MWRNFFVAGLLLVSAFLALGGVRSVWAIPTKPGVEYKIEPTPWFVSTPVSISQDLVKVAKNPAQVDMSSYGLRLLTQLLGHGTLLMIGPLPVDENGQILRDKNGKPLITNNGAAGFAIAGIDILVKHPPASSADYIAYMGSKLRIPGTPEPVYAADGGYGFRALQPVLTIWTVSRNLAYFLFAIVFVVVGMMIMFRIKIDPKTVASIQNALPRIIFALILVTFSYAIAGFLIDLMYLMMTLVFALAKAAAPSFGPLTAGQVDFLQNKILNEGNSLFDFFLQAGWGLGASLNASIAIFKVIFAFFYNVGNNTITDPIQLALNQLFGIIGLGAGAIVGVFAFFLLAAMMIWALFKTWLALLSAYINILLGVMFAPLRLTMDAIPGQNQFTAWIKDLLANLLAFPLVALLVLIGGMITGGNNLWESGGFVPPLIGSNDQRAIQALIGFGLLLSIPRALDILREALKAPAFKYGNAWMENTQPLKAIAAGYLQSEGTSPTARGWQKFLYGMGRTVGLTK